MMKKSTKFVMACGAFLFVGASGVFAQKQCNLAITLTSPTANQVIPQTNGTNDTAWLEFSIKNNGPAAIVATDTIFYAVGTSVYAYNAPSGIGVNATVNVTRNEIGLYFPNTHNETTDQPATICVALLDQANVQYTSTTPPTPAMVTYVDTDTTNDVSCVEVTMKAKTVGIFELNNVTTEELSLYPNPANGEVNFNLNLDKTENVVVTVKDIAGREVLRNNFGKVQAGNAAPFKLNVASLNAGMYFVELNAGERKAVGKLTVSH